MNSGKGTGAMLPVSEPGKSDSYAFTSGIDETIFIFEEFYRRNFSTIIKGKIIIHLALPISSLGMITEA